MAKYTGSVCKLCRREGLKLFLKGTRCYTDKCAIERQPYPPGQHKDLKVKPTDYAVHLREKQKLKRIYGLLERQFVRYFSIASRLKGDTGENLLMLLEQRLDNVVYRLGFGRSIKEARQMINHGHILVNDRKVDIPSYIVRKNDIVSIREKSRGLAQVLEGMQLAEKRVLPAWLELNPAEFKGVVKERPGRADIPMHIKEQLIVEFYSR